MTGAALFHAGGCELPATTLCDACARPCCPNHILRIALERRQEAAEIREHHDLLARVPSSVVPFTLCPRCGKRPFDGVRRGPPPQV